MQKLKLGKRLVSTLEPWESENPVSKFWLSKCNFCTATPRLGLGGGGGGAAGGVEGAAKPAHSRPTTSHSRPTTSSGQDLPKAPSASSSRTLGGGE
jgi:hypothetical protein